ncbi:carboxypeptidase regulatory-like domain-containing protein [Infirmifilum lucidum]|uniref:Carboxypeptidase regulatory-like domain-containing protein n=1 Tax=Infirmifilum lucidum TaxID=2776706 RepID=A0A7L9FGP6_9CREN|nr:carboxypeptidase-like regulatory domain-containing protein [Infirmifilum lucidum]QOJ78980.1 carboxypeptidase regulatory-like domain-containing protein [Infirmifilum lucidum]
MGDSVRIVKDFAREASAVLGDILVLLGREEIDGTELLNLFSRLRVHVENMHSLRGSFPPGHLLAMNIENIFESVESCVERLKDFQGKRVPVGIAEEIKIHVNDVRERLKVIEKVIEEEFIRGVRPTPELPKLYLHLDSPKVVKVNTCASVVVQVTDGSSPVAGAEVTLSWAGGTVDPASGLTDSKGYFRAKLCPLQPGEYALTVRVTKENFIEARETAVVRVESEETRIVVRAGSFERAVLGPVVLGRDKGGEGNLVLYEPLLPISQFLEKARLDYYSAVEHLRVLAETGTPVPRKFSMAHFVIVPSGNFFSVFCLNKNSTLVRVDGSERLIPGGRTLEEIKVRTNLVILEVGKEALKVPIRVEVVSGVPKRGVPTITENE